jgi:putative tricarboxylic transport membrane protein
VLEIPREVLYAAIVVFAVLGTYTVSNSITEVFIMLAIGVVGFFMRRYDFPIAPVILGVILGPLMENQFRRTLIVSDGDFGAIFERPLSLELLAVAALMLVAPHVPAVARRLRGFSG